MWLLDEVGKEAEEIVVKELLVEELLPDFDVDWGVGVADAG